MQHIQTVSQLTNQAQSCLRQESHYSENDSDDDGDINGKKCHCKQSVTFSW